MSSDQKLITIFFVLAATVVSGFSLNHRISMSENHKLQEIQVNNGWTARDMVCFWRHEPLLCGKEKE